MDGADREAVALMEASLMAVAGAVEAGAQEICFPLFERFFLAFPERRATFYTLESSSRRMTDETVQMLYGLAAGEDWVQGLVNELSYTHRQYGMLPQGEYDVWVDLTVDVLRDTAGPVWTAQCEAAWRAQAGRLKVMVAEAKIGWVAAMAPS